MQNSLSLRSSFFWATLFSISMGFLESAVVIYLRKLYYPEGFDFPMVPMEQVIMVTELFRELGTILMLLSAAAMLARSFLGRFAFFAFCFGIWDIFYYVFLKLVLDWPSSFLTQDILFLIPMPWFGPVFAPMLVSLGLILLGVVIVLSQQRDPGFRILPKEWVMMVLGAVVIILSFVLDHAVYVLSEHSWQRLLSFSQEKLLEVTKDYIPRNFHLNVFLAGVLIAVLGLVSILRRSGLLERKGT